MVFIYLFIDKFELSNDFLPNVILDTRHKKEEEGNIVPTFLPLNGKCQNETPHLHSVLKIRGHTEAQKNLIYSEPYTIASPCLKEP